MEESGAGIARGAGNNGSLAGQPCAEHILFGRIRIEMVSQSLFDTFHANKSGSLRKAAQNGRIAQGYP